MARPRRRAGYALGAIAMIAAVIAGLASNTDDTTPWPRGTEPSPTARDAMLADALEIDSREQAEEWLAASEAGEASDHVAILQSDIDAGVYTPARLFKLGDELFAHPFTVNPDGYGDGKFTTLRRVHNGVRGGLDTFSCEGCHSVGGPDGAGSDAENAFLAGDGDHVSSALVRNAPALLGAGMVQALAAEMSVELRYNRDQAIEEALAKHAPVVLALVTHGVSFGALTIAADGSVDASKVEGVDADLVVKPFGWKGTTARLRRFAEDAARVHFGIQSHVLALGDQQKPDPAHLGDGPWYDPDGDGHTHELEEGSLTTLAVYMAMLEAPVMIPPFDEGLRARWSNGSGLFQSIGCASCHTHLALANTVWHETSDTTNGSFAVDLFQDGDKPKGTNDVQLFSDLKRHHMGDALADAHDNELAIPRDVFVTRPLWGLAESAPYLHDGRAGTIPEAILAHGGEAQGARDAFAALDADSQADLHVYLLSLTREPKVRVAR